MEKVNSNQFQQIQQRHESKPREVSEHIPDAYKKIAKDMEAQYLKLMVEQMNRTAPSSKPDSSANKIYKAMLTDERAKLMAEQNKGLGLQKMILDQIYPQRLRNTHAFGKYQKTQEQTNDQSVIRPVSKEADNE